MLRQCLLLGLVVVGLAGCEHPDRRPAPPKRAAAGELGSSLPEFSVKDLHGNQILSSAMRGKVVLIDFWATWCQPCKKEMPGYQKLADEYGARGLVVIGFKFDTMPDTEDPLHFADGIGVHYPLAVATDDLKQKFGGIEGLPTTMLYDRQGVLRAKVIGFEYTEAFDTAVKPLLSGTAQSE